jgi:hypothetical protein
MRDTYSCLDAAAVVAAAAAGTSALAGAVDGRAHARWVPFPAACPSWALPG